MGVSDWILILATALGGLGFLAMIYYFAAKGYKRRDQERMEAVIKKTDDLGGEDLGCIRVWRKPPFSFIDSLIEDTLMIHELLVITPNKVLVERIREEKNHDPYGPLFDPIRYVKKRKTEDRLEADENFAISKSEITKVDLHKFGWRGRGVTLNIITNEKEYKWYGNGLVLPDGWKIDVKLEDYENILRLAFPNKLSVS